MLVMVKGRSGAFFRNTLTFYISFFENFVYECLNIISNRSTLPESISFRRSTKQLQIFANSSQNSQKSPQDLITDRFARARGETQKQNRSHPHPESEKPSKARNVQIIVLNNDYLAVGRVPVQVRKLRR